MTKPSSYGYGKCLYCGTKIVFRIRRDIERKHFCSRRCAGKHSSDIGRLAKMRLTAYTAESRRKHSDTLKLHWKTHKHYMAGRHLTESAKAKISRAQKLRPNDTYLHGPRHHRWKGGRRFSSGYLMVACPEHPLAKTKLWYRHEHRLVAELHLGRVLSEEEIVHHINGNKLDNRPENLAIMSNSEHISLHNRGLLVPEYDGQFVSWTSIPLIRKVSHAGELSRS